MASPAPPDEELARTLAQSVFDTPVRHVARFTTGSSHYVYDVILDDRRPVVMRIGDGYAHQAMTGAVMLSQQLRPLGVPLPQLLAADVRAPLPWMALERLPGTDLGAVLARLTQAQLSSIARGVTRAQSLVAATPSAGRYGIAARPEDAPFESWAAVMRRAVERSRHRIAQAGLFDLAAVDALAAVIAAMGPQLAGIAATPYLHDTTTKNVIIDASGAMAGIVDVDDLGFGDPRQPIALTFAALLNTGHPVDYARMWLAEMGGEDDRVFRLYVATSLLDFMSEHGQRFNGNLPESKPEARRTVLALFQEQLTLIR